MASVVTRKNRTREIRFTLNRKPRTVRLGRCDKKTADEAKRHIEKIIEAIRHNQTVKMETAKWMTSIGGPLYERFTRAGLVEPRETAANVLDTTRLFDAFIERRTDLKAGTIAVLKQARRHLVGFFAADRSADSITVGEGKDFRRKLAAKYSVAYTGKMIRQNRQVWKDAIERGHLLVNPWAAVQAGTARNPERSFYIDRTTINAVIAEAPDDQWKLIIALSRFGGLRCPSEHLALTWDDVDWAKGRLTIRSSKTERHIDKGIRVIPLWPEIREHLQRVFDAAEAGTAHVITRYRVANTNLRTQFNKFITRAGYTPWPRLFHNLRASRQTELADLFPAHVVCKWIGNSEEIAKAHYLQVRDEHFAKALEGAPQPVGMPVAAPGQLP